MLQEALNLPSPLKWQLKDNIGNIGQWSGETENRLGEYYECPRLLCRESFKAMAYERGWQMEAGSVLSWGDEIGSREMPRSLKFTGQNKGQMGAVQTLLHRSSEGHSQTFQWAEFSTFMQGNYYKLGEVPPTRIRENNNWNSQKAWNCASSYQSDWRIP